MTRRDFFRLSVTAWKPASTRQAATVNREQCIAWGEGPCRMCETRCPIPGVLTWDRGPVIDAAACDGCGKCVDACAAVNMPPALTLESQRESEARP